MNVYERLGRLLEQHQQEQEAHLNTLQLLGALKRGEVKLEQIIVAGNRWQMLPQVPTRTPEQSEAP